MTSWLEFAVYALIKTMVLTIYCKLDPYCPVKFNLCTIIFIRFNAEYYSLLDGIK
jgi:hypothetical protein